MGAKTGIEWCDSTVNGTTGCEGCELWGPNIRRCYAGNLHEKRLARSLPLLYAPDFQEVRLAPGRMKKAAGWADLRGRGRPDKPWLNGMPRMIFVGDMGDFMSRSVPDDYFKTEILGAIESRSGRRHFWLLLTKQIRRLADLSKHLGGLPDNCMAMTTITDQRTADTRIPDLLRTVCKWRGVSAEPLWGQIEIPRAALGRCYGCQTCMFSGWHQIAEPRIHWLIGGGESEQDAETPPKYSHPDWFRSLRDQCAAARVPFFMKQMTRLAPIPDDLLIREIPQISTTETKGDTL